MRCIIAISASLAVIGPVRAQAPAPRTSAAPRVAQPAAPRAGVATRAPSRNTPATPPSGPARRPRAHVRIYVPERKGSRPIATGMDGLDVPIDRKTYSGRFFYAPGGLAGPFP